MKSHKYFSLKIFLSICIFGLISCSVTNNDSELDSKTDPKEINRDNNIYVNNREFYFSYNYYDKENKSLACFVIDTGKMQWQLMDKSYNKGFRIDKIKLKVHYKTMDSLVSVEQTPIEYCYFTKNKEIGFKEQTSISENDKMVVINAPRFYGFYSSQLLSPPNINYPLSIGHSWSSSILIPEETIKFLNLNTPIKIKQTGNIENKYDNIVKDTITLETKLGKLFCYIVNTESYDKNKLPALTSYFNERYGFVKLNYFNSDSSRIEYNLEQVTDK